VALRADEGLQASHDVGRVHRAVRDLRHPLELAGIGQAAGQHLGLAHDGRERVVDLVRDAGDELADRGQLARLQELLLCRLELVELGVQLGVEAGILQREGGVVGEGLGEMDLVVGEAAALDVRDAERPDDGAADDQGDRARRGGWTGRAGPPGRTVWRSRARRGRRT
jgi:hypothetical protein